MAFETGWTSLPATPPTHEWFVSRSLGDDSNTGLAQGSPKRTLASLRGLTAPGDWVNLYDQDTWDKTLEPTPGLTHLVEVLALANAGVVEASASRPFVIKSYGLGTRRPVVRPWNDGGAGAGLRSSVGMTGVFVFNIDFWGDRLPEEAVRGVLIEGGSVDRVRVEGCRFRDLFGAIGISPDVAGGDVYVHRCRSNRISLNQPSGNAIGFYFSKVTAHESENGGDYGGWDPANGVEAAKRNVQRRQSYHQTDCVDPEVHRNLYLRSSSEAVQVRVRCRASCNVAALASGAGWTHHDGGTGSAAADVVTGLLQLGSADIDDATPRGGGIEIENGTGAYSLVILAGRGLGMGSDVNGLVLKGTADVTVDLLRTLDFQSAAGSGNGVVSYSGAPRLTLKRSDVQGSGANFRCVDLASVAPGTLGATSDGNRYSSGNATPFYGDAGAVAFPAWRTQWAPAEAGSSYGDVTGDYPGAGSVSIEAYMASLGGTPTLDAFSAEDQEQRWGNWRPAYTAGAVFNFALAKLGLGLFVQNPPGGLGAVAATGGVSLQWAAVTGLIDAPGYGVASYRVYKSTDAGATFSLLATVTGASVYADAAGVAGHRYRVSAVDTEGFETHASASVASAAASGGTGLPVAGGAGGTDATGAGGSGGGGGGGSGTLASAVIDRASLARLVTAAVAHIDGVELVPSRAADTDALPAWCRVASVALNRHPRVMQGKDGPDEAETGDCKVTMEVGVSQSLRNAYAFESAAMRVVLALHEVRLAAGATGTDATHELLMRCTEEPDVMVDTERKIEVGVIVFEGIAERSAGNSMLDFVS